MQSVDPSTFQIFCCDEKESVIGKKYMKSNTPPKESYSDERPRSVDRVRERSETGGKNGTYVRELVQMPASVRFGVGKKPNKEEEKGVGDRETQR